MVALGRRADRAPRRPRRQIQHLLAGARLGHDLVLGHDEAAPVGRRRRGACAPACARRAPRHRPGRCRDRSSAAPARHGRARRAACRRRACRSGRWCANTSSLSVVSACTAKRSRSPSLYLTLGRRRSMCPRMARIQPFSEQMTVTGSRSIDGLERRSRPTAGASAELGAALAERGASCRSSCADLADLGRRSPSTAGPRPAAGLERPSARPCSALCSLSDLDLLELAQGAQAHVEDRLGLRRR